MRCGALMATYLGLGRLAARAGLARRRAATPLGTLGATGRLRLGARRASDRRGYVDPLLLLADGARPLPHLGPAPRALRRHPLPPTRPAPRPIAPATPPAPGSAAAPRRLPWPAYPALALVASALPRRRPAAPPAPADRRRGGGVAVPALSASMPGAASPDAPQVSA